MWFLGDLFPPLEFSGFASAIILCFLGFYIIKRLSGDGNVPVRDSTKNHSWTPLTISSKVCNNIKFLNPQFSVL